nr:MAG TPA: hypothetical protein [Caudoviricetes sp.]
MTTLLTAVYSINTDKNICCQQVNKILMVVV